MTAPGDAIDPVCELPADGRDSDEALFVRQLPVIEEMLGMLDTLTTAGQRHVLEKVVSFVESKTCVLAPRMSNRNRATLLELLTQLREETQRFVPDPARFTRLAGNLIRLLGAVG